MNDVQTRAFFGSLFIDNRTKMSSQAMNPRESAAFIASVAQDVKIDPIGIQNVANEVNLYITVFNLIFSNHIFLFCWFDRL
jgi:hypothetical protein